MALEPIDIAFRNAPSSRPEESGVGLPAWKPTGDADPGDVNRFRVALGELGEARPAERIWGMISGWNEAVKTDMHTMAAALNQEPPLSEIDMMRLNIKSHSITLTQSIMAKVGSSLNDTYSALVRGQ